jgi:hypothetical protein
MLHKRTGTCAPSAQQVPILYLFLTSSVNYWWYFMDTGVEAVKSRSSLGSEKNRAIEIGTAGEHIVWAGRIEPRQLRGVLQ